MIVFIYGVFLIYKIMMMFEFYFRDYKLIFINCLSCGRSLDLDCDIYILDDYVVCIYDVLM